MSAIPILLVTRPGIGGAAKHVRMICELIDKSAFSVSVAASPLEDPAFLDDLARTGVRVTPFPIRREPHPHDAVVLYRLVRLLRRRRPALIHAHTSKPGLLARLAGSASGLPTLYTPHGFYFHYDLPAWKRTAYRALERVAGLWTTRLVCVTEEEKRQALEAGLAPEERLVVLPNALKIEECEPSKPRAEVRAALNIPQHAPLLAMIGRLDAPKDPFTLVRAAHRLAPDVHVLFAGEGRQKEEVRALARELRMENRVLLPGHRTDPIDLAAAADIAVLSSRWEGLPFALLEAMAVSRPVVASDVSGCRDALGESGAGILVTPGDPDTMARALGKLIADPRARATMGAAGRLLVETKYTAGRWIRRLEDLYRSVLHL
ncbi:MAG: glycosyltransferase [Candidatus Brocadiae bacterium]|nr:glycosyltransferase [Candidatus Brocadiia bacterium]